MNIELKRDNSLQFIVQKFPADTCTGPQRDWILTEMYIFSGFKSNRKTLELC